MRVPGLSQLTGPSLRQTQRPSQALALTPQLRQAIQLLQLSNLELEGVLQAQIEANPLLARESDAGEDGAGAQSATAEAGDGTGDPAPLDGALESGEPIGAIGEDAVEDLWDGGEPAPVASAEWSGARPIEHRGADGMIADRPPLREHLLNQIAHALADPIDRAIALQLVDGLDEAGYLALDMAALAGQLGVRRERVDAVLAAVQGMEPVGVFARSLAECLAIQLNDRNRLDPAMRVVLANLDLLAQGDKKRLMRLAGVDAGDLDDIIAEIRSLDPRPAAGFDAAPPAPIVPDVLMRAGADGCWIIELNPETLPRLIVDRRYHAMLARDAKAMEARRFLSARLSEANWLVRALDQRARTILAVATAIVARQGDFFAHGVARLRPLVLREIAAAIEMHESTVSRATANKYIATPRGLFALRYFFSAAVGAGPGGDAHSAESVRHRIRALIAGEATILSDDALVEALRRDGYVVARRTVAKYRETMRIPSSVERRRQRTLGLR
jgi:RNA polymerase sigma-54 factor